MYNTPYFKTKDNAEVISFMKAHPFIILCGTDATGFPVATHVPVLIEEKDGKIFLTGHIMRKQQHTLAFAAQQKVLAVFYGAHSYVSASWYETKNVASTWNYQAVHAKGILQWMNDEALYQLLIHLTNHFERTEHSAAAVKNMSKEYIEKNMQAIVGFEIEITHLQHVFKLSQNRDKKSYENITKELSKGTEEQKAIAEKMKEIKDKTFNE
jgi:transcriptional regulator